jgi:hypothetical protein
VKRSSVIPLLVSLLACQGRSMPTSSQTPSSPSPELHVVSIQHQPEYVIEYPIYVAIVLEAPQDTSFNRLPFANLVDLNECIGLEVVDAGNHVVASYTPKPVLDPEHGGEALGAGQRRRMLTDVSPLIPVTIPAGDYRLRLAYVSPHMSISAAPVAVRLRRPTPAEKAQLSLLSAELARFPSWATWTISQPPALAPAAAGTIAADNPLKLNLLLHRLFFGPEPLDRADPSALDILTDVYEPEGNALKAELYRARGDTARHQALKASTLAAEPGMAWWFQMIDAGGGFLSSFRSAPSTP